MEIKLTKKDFKGCDVIAFGYGDFQEIIYVVSQFFAEKIEKIGYNYGVYGWNWNIFRITNKEEGRRIYICTGYRPFGRKPRREVLKQAQEVEDFLKQLDYRSLERHKRKAYNALIKLVE